MSRVKSLVRLKTLTDELRLRAATARAISMEDGLAGAMGDEAGLILLVDSRPTSQERIVRSLRPIAEVVTEADPQAALFSAAEGEHELVIVNANFVDYDPLRLCSQLRSLERTRFLPILLIAEQGDDDLIVRALDLGVTDYLIRPIDPNELVARSLTQIRRKRYNDRLRTSVRETIELAVTDGLTGLHNRRYLDNHMKLLVDRATARRRALSVCITDIDRFKQVNDTHGHDAGDAVLREFANRVRSAVRGADLACRYGGEEFVLIMPDTTAEMAAAVAERLREIVELEPFRIPGSDAMLSITASLGIAEILPEGDTPDALMKRADEALYEAKRSGRNRVVAAAA